jgi:hypothetical protein
MLGMARVDQDHARADLLNDRDQLLPIGRLSYDVPFLGGP